MKIFIRERARTDIIDIWTYSFFNWGEQQADEYADQIEAALKTIADHPGIGGPWLGTGKDYRRLRVRYHVIYYRLLETYVEVVRVLHERMDADKQFDED